MKKLTNNLSLKIIAVLVATFIWLFVSGINDPVKTNVRYSVKVNVVNDQYIYDSNKTYQIADEDRNVMVYVTGKQSVVENRTDIAVEADMTQISEMDEKGLVYVPVHLKEVRGITQSDVTIIPQTIPVSIEDMDSKEFVVTATTAGTPADGYEIGETTVNPEKLEVSGPASVIKKIKSIVANVNVEGIREDTDYTTGITVYDQNGDVMTDSMEYLNIFKAGANQTVDVSVKLWKVRDNVRIKANYSGTPADGYMVDKVITTPEVISVAGSEEALRKLDENNNTIEIPADLIDISGTSQDLEANIKLSSLLKEEDGFKLPEDAAQSVLVKVSILPYGSKELHLKTSDVKVDGLSTDLRLAFSQSTITIRVRAPEADLENLQESDIQARIDLSAKVAGEYTLPVSVKLPEGYEQVENSMVTVQLTKVDSNTEG